MDQPVAEEALGRLERFVGAWTMRARADTWAGEGTTTFEWHPDRAHLLQRATVDHPDAPNALSVIGCDGAKDTYTQLYSDERGVCRVYDMTFDGTTWTLERRGEPFAQRYVGTFSDDGATIAGQWQIDDDGSGYRPDFDVVLERRTGE
jgi:hypothetical protein